MLERKHITTSGGLLGSVVYEVMYYQWAHHGLGRVERRHRKAFFVPDWGKLTGYALYNSAQAHGYGGRHQGTTLTWPETTHRFPREADAVQEEAQTPEGPFRAGVAALLACASSQEVAYAHPAPPLWSPP